MSWPWRFSKFELPNNHSLAKARLKSLVHNLNKDTMLMKKYDDVIKKQMVL